VTAVVRLAASSSPPLTRGFRSRDPEARLLRSRWWQRSSVSPHRRLRR